MGTVVERSTFAAGEVSPTLRSRNDLARQQAAVAQSENMVVLVEGGLTRRPGTRFIAAHKVEGQKAKKIPFRYSETDSYVLVVNGATMRFLRNGGVIVDGGGNPYEVAVPWAEADLPNLRWAGSGNLIFLFCAGYQPRVLTRNGHANWTLALYQSVNGPVDVQNTNTGLTIKASGTVGAITLTANTARFTPDDVGTIWRLDPANLDLVPMWKGNETITANSQRRNAGWVYQALTSGDTGPNPPTSQEIGQRVASGGGNVTWLTANAGHGYVRITAVPGNPSTTASATVIKQLPNEVVTTATYRWWPPVWSAARGWPDNVKLHDGRLFMSRGGLWWLTKANDFYDFDITSDDDSAIAARLMSQDGSQVTIRWAQSAGILVLGTASEEGTLRGGTGDTAAITVANVVSVPEASEGSAVHVPASVDGGAVFIGKSRKRLHFAKFDRLASTIEVEEISVSARHILAGRAIACAFQRDPHRLLWIACEDGSLRAVTIMPKQGVLGWGRHPLVNGQVEDLISIPSADGTVDELYLSVRRTINGATRRYIEVLSPFFEPEDPDNPTAAGAWFVDCGLGYEGAPVSAVSGLEHLEGETVRVFADGAQRDDAVVTAGQVTLAAAASSIVVGLPLRAYVKSLPFELATTTGSSKGKAKQATRVVADLVETAGASIASNAGTPEPLILSGTLDYGAGLPLHSEAAIVTLDSPTEIEVVLELIADNALPATLTGWAPDIDVTE